jgi:hypothetical protein
MADDSALVFVAPSDGFDTIVRKIRETGAQSVELLVPDETAALQEARSFARLRQLLDRDRVSLLVISSDDKTLSAARSGRIDTVGVQGARVMAPPPAPTGGRSAARPADARATAPLGDDAEFLDALDQMAIDDRYADDLDAGVDDRSSATQAGRVTPGDDEFAAALGGWAAGAPETPAGEDWEVGPRAAPPTRRRVRAEDVELGEDELRRQRGARRTAALRSRDAGAAGREGADARRARAAATPMFEREAEEELAPRRAGLGLAIPLLLLLLIVAATGFWFVRSRATIVVAAPATSASQKPFAGEVMPLAEGAEKSQGAVRAVPISAAAEFQVQGQVISETLSPVGTAKGIITIYNTIAQPISLPEGTQFVAVKDQGQEVRFKIDQPATVPPATTSSSVTGSNTMFGQIDVAITALSPGSASNVGENAIKQIVIPGQEPIVVGNSNFNVVHAPIGGGNEQLVRVVTEADVQRKLQEALTGLYSTGIDQLEAQIGPSQEIDPVSITPNADALSRPENYEIAVEPAVGAQVPADNPNFTIAVRTTFGALATPRGQRVRAQLDTALPEHFQSPCKPGETTRVEVSDYRWDGQRLTIDGVLTCVPSGGLAPEAISRVKRAVGGKSRGEAEQNLRALQQEGLIGEYALPPGRDTFPSLDFLLTVEEAQPDEPRPTPAP